MHTGLPFVVEGQTLNPISSIVVRDIDYYTSPTLQARSTTKKKLDWIVASFAFSYAVSDVCITHTL